MIFRQNDELNLALQSKFITRNEKQLIYERLINAHLGLQGLIGFWNMANVDAANNGDVWSSSGGDKTLSNVNTVAFANDGILPYAQITNASINYLNRADEATFDISGNEVYIDSSINGLTTGGLFYFDSSTVSNQSLISKRGAAVSSIAYYLNRANSDVFNFVIYDGITTDGFSHSQVVANNVWCHVACRYDRSSLMLDIFVDGVKEGKSTTLTTISNSSFPFRIGAQGNNSLYMDGRVTNAFLCASSIDDAQLKYIASLSTELNR